MPWANLWLHSAADDHGAPHRQGTHGPRLLPAGWKPAPATAKTAATTHEFTPGEVLATPAFYFMWVAYALGASAGLMVISQLVPFAKSVHISSAALATMTLVVGAAGFVSLHIGTVPGLTLMAVYLTVHGIFCLANFLRCRETHCIVTGAGWSLLALVAARGAPAGVDIRQDVWDAFPAVTIVGFPFELLWRAVRADGGLWRRRYTF